TNLRNWRGRINVLKRSAALRGEFNFGAVEAELFANGILQVTQKGEVKRARIVEEERKPRWTDIDLCSVIHLHFATTILGRWIPSYRASEDLIELSGRNSLEPFECHFARTLDNSRASAPGERGDIDDRRIRHEFEHLSHIFGELVDGLVALRHKVPL